MQSQGRTLASRKRSSSTSADRRRPSNKRRHRKLRQISNSPRPAAHEATPSDQNQSYQAVFARNFNDPLFWSIHTLRRLGYGFSEIQQASGCDKTFLEQLYWYLHIPIRTKPAVGLVYPKNAKSKQESEKLESMIADASTIEKIGVKEMKEMMGRSEAEVQSGKDEGKEVKTGEDEEKEAKNDEDGDKEVKNAENEDTEVKNDEDEDKAIRKAEVKEDTKIDNEIKKKENPTSQEVEEKKNNDGAVKEGGAVEKKDLDKTSSLKSSNTDSNKSNLSSSKPMALKVRSSKEVENAPAPSEPIQSNDGAKENQPIKSEHDINGYVQSGITTDDHDQPSNPSNDSSTDRNVLNRPIIQSHPHNDRINEPVSHDSSIKTEELPELKKIVDFEDTQGSTSSVDKENTPSIERLEPKPFNNQSWKDGLVLEMSDDDDDNDDMDGKQDEELENRVAEELKNRAAEKLAKKYREIAKFRKYIAQLQADKDRRERDTLQSDYLAGQSKLSEEEMLRQEIQREKQEWEDRNQECKSMDKAIDFHMSVIKKQQAQYTETLNKNNELQKEIDRNERRLKELTEKQKPTVIEIDSSDDDDDDVIVESKKTGSTKNKQDKEVISLLSI